MPLKIAYMVALHKACKCSSLEASELQRLRQFLWYSCHGRYLYNIKAAVVILWFATTLFTIGEVPCCHKLLGIVIYACVCFPLRK